jgi:hypothetical protein
LHGSELADGVPTRGTTHRVPIYPFIAAMSQANGGRRGILEGMRKAGSSGKESSAFLPEIPAFLIQNQRFA